MLGNWETAVKYCRLLSVTERAGENKSRLGVSGMFFAFEMDVPNVIRVVVHAAANMRIMLSFGFVLF